MNGKKQNKLLYYLKGYLSFLLPAGKNYKQKIISIERKLSAEQSLREFYILLYPIQLKESNYCFSFLTEIVSKNYY